MKVRYSPRAVQDLAGIADYLAQRSPAGARAVESAIRSTVRLLEAFPGSGRALEQRPAVRVVPVTRYPYLVFYASADDSVVVLHVRHGAREPVGPGEL
jgi:plasmid stabilization system protein ParE